MTEAKNSLLFSGYKRTFFLICETLTVLWVLLLLAYHFNIEKPARFGFVLSILIGFWFERLYLVGHEAAHGKLIPHSLFLNDLMGQVVLTPILVPIAVFRKIHFFHHGHNRRDQKTSALDTFVLSSPLLGIKKSLSYLTWYGNVFFGGFFLHSVISIMLFLCFPISLARRISPAFQKWTVKDQIQSIAVFSIGVGFHFIVISNLGLEAWVYLLGIPFLSFMWLYSLLTYIYHYRTSFGPKVNTHVRSLKMNKFAAWWLLNFNEHTTHHRNPAIPWFELPVEGLKDHQQLSDHGKMQKTFLRAILDQLKGPTIIEAGK